MATRSGVLVVGNTVLMESVTLSLLNRRTISVDRINPKITDIKACATVTKPDVIVFEIGCPQSPIILSLLHEMPGTLLLGMDLHTDRAVVMNSQACAMRSMVELHQIFDSLLSIGARMQRKMNERTQGSA